MPVRRSYPQPWTLRAFVFAYLVTAVYWTVFISGGGALSMVWIVGLAGVYLIWRGSRSARIVSALLLGAGTIQSVIFVEAAMSPGGHHPIVHVVEAALLVTLLVLLLLPDTRRFGDRKPEVY